MESTETAAPATPAPAPTGDIDRSITTSPEKALSIRDAWRSVEAEHGPVSFTDGEPVEPTVPETDEAKAEREAAETAKAEKKAAKEAKAKADAEEKEEPAEKGPGVKDLIKEQQKLREKEERRVQFHARQAQALERDYQAKYQHLATVEQKLAPLMDAAKAVEVGDFDGIAQAIGKFLGNEDVKDWKALNSEALKAIQSPMYKRMRDLERQREDDRKTQAETQAQLARVEQERTEKAQVEQWHLTITDELSDDEDPAVQALIKAKPDFAARVYAIQKAHYHKNDGDILPAREALASVALNDVFSELEFWNEFIEEHSDSPVVQKFTGRRSAKNSEKTDGTRSAESSEKNGTRKTATSERRAGPPAKNVSHTRAAEASPAIPMDDASIKKLFKSKMEQDFAALR